MLREYVHNAPYTRAARYRMNATNADLVRDVIDATRAAWPCIEWPQSIPRRNAAFAAWQFARDRVRYVREDGDQLIRMPWRTLEDGQGDCKSLSVLVASLCRAAGCRVALRFVRYPGDDHFGHVYAVVDGVPVDPELAFGDQVLSVEQIDRTV
jgi:transglutaminase-like putative cysteine protease